MTPTPYVSVGAAMGQLIETSRQRSLFRADWDKALFLHYTIDPALLQPQIPFELDIYDGQAYVSMVAFTQRRLRPNIGGRLSAILASPLAEHEFFNVRTYVRVDGERAIFFIAEWIPNRLAVLIGPRTYGLPYRQGRLRYCYGLQGRVQGSAQATTGESFSYDAQVSPEFLPAADGTLAEFLIERYVAFTCRGTLARRFEVSHAPWLLADAKAQVTDSSLLSLTGAWHEHSTLATAHYSPGVKDVQISVPQRCGVQVHCAI